MTAVGVRHSAGYLLAVLTLVNTINWADRQVVPVLFGGIRTDLGLTDTQLGVIGGLAFAAIYAISAFVFGRLADRGIRRNLILGGLIAWCFATMASGLAQGFGSLFAARFFTGIGEASLYPCAMSLFAERYPAATRGRAMGIFGAAAAIGGGIGQGFGGVLSEAIGWRQVFFLYGALGLLAVPLVASLPADDPDRVNADPKSWATIVEVLKDSRLLALWTAGSVMIGSAIGFGAWMPEFLQRVRGFEPAGAGGLAGIGLLLGGILGSLMGGAFADRRRKVRLAGELDVSVMAALCAAPLMFGFIYAPWDPVVYICGAFAPIAIFAFFPSMQTILMDIVPSEKLGTAYAVHILFLGGIGTSLGPFVTGLVSDMTGSLQTAMLTTMIGALLAGGLAAFTGAHIRRRPAPVGAP